MFTKSNVWVVWLRGWLLISLLSVAVSAWAKPAIYTGWLSKTAVSGYDTVAYFTQGAPIKGNKKYAYTYKKANWLFSNPKNLALFQKNPEKYAPQYGGYCSYAMYKHEFIKADPTQWAIYQGKLYLNFDQATHKKWLTRKVQYVPVANTFWKASLKNGTIQ